MEFVSALSLFTEVRVRLQLNFDVQYNKAANPIIDTLYEQSRNKCL